MKTTFIILASLFSITAYTQVGVNTTNPNATLDVIAKRNDGTTPEGLIVPRLSGDEIKLGDSQYTVQQKGTLIYSTSAVTASSPKTINITSPGYYFFDGSIWQKITTGTYNGSVSVELNNGIFQRAALTGDVYAATNSNTTIVSDNAITTSKIANNAVTPGKIQGSGISAQVLGTDSAGNPVWTNSTLITPTIVGGNFTDVSNFDNVNYRPMGSITLPKGNWIVSWVLQLGFTGSTTFPKSYHILSQLSASNNSINTTGFSVKNGLYGTLTGNMSDSNQQFLGQIRGASYINVTSASVTLYVISNGIFSGSLNSSNVKFQGTYGENSIFATPVN